MSDKKCTRCGEVLPTTTKYFHRNKAVKDGFDTRCKICRNEIAKEYRQKNKDRLRQYDLDRRHRFRDKIGILPSPLHQFIRKRKPKQKYCSICNKEKKLQLASIGHTYTRNIEDYIWLCQSCHCLFDECMEVITI